MILFHEKRVRNVKFIPNEECQPKHKLLVMDIGGGMRKLLKQ